MDKQLETLKEQLRQQEKMASLGMLSAGIAHEIQNPLNFVINFSKISDKLLNDLTEIVEDNIDKFPDDDRHEVDDIMADLKENMAKIAEHGERAINIIQDILMASRGKENEFLPTDVSKLVKEYVWLAYHALRAARKGFNISIHEHYQEDIPKILAIPQDLSRAVLNIVNNACYTVWHKSLTAGDDYTPELDVSVSMDGGDIVIRIADNGEGMSDEVKQRLFENFFTTKPIGQGTGLGMGITRDIIENKHAGSLKFLSTLGQGTTFTFTIPVRT